MSTATGRARNSRLKANDRLHGKIGDEDAGKHGSAALSYQFSVKAHALNDSDN